MAFRPTTVSWSCVSFIWRVALQHSLGWECHLVLHRWLFKIPNRLSFHLNFLWIRLLKLPPRSNLENKIANKQFPKNNRKRVQDLFNTVIVLMPEFSRFVPTCWKMLNLCPLNSCYICFLKIYGFLKKLCFKIQLKLWSENWHRLSRNLPCSLSQRPILNNKFWEGIPRGCLKVHSLMPAKEATSLCRQTNYLNYFKRIIREKNVLKFLENDHA